MSDDKTTGDQTQQKDKSGGKYKMKTREEHEKAIIELYKLDAEVDVDMLKTLTDAAVEEEKNTSTILRQKKDQRKRADGYEAVLKEAGLDPETGKPVEEDKKGDKSDDSAQSIFDKRDLEDFDGSDELKEQVKNVADTQGISIRIAIKDSYIQHKLTEEKEAADADEASADKGSGGQAKKKIEDVELEDIDASTDEGEKQFERKKAQLKQDNP